jgi:glycosyltransferase involved in cell wall biosynthesis
MRILIFHGYLLSGTGSNVYNARLAEALVRMGHEVHLLSQDRHPERQPFVAATGLWEDGSLRVRGARGRCTVYRPDIGGLLPVYVPDRYEGIEARSFLDCSAEQIAAYVQANVAAVRDVTSLAQPDVALANHLVMGPLILARALAGAVPYAVKVHGSALEYTVKRDPQRFLEPAREGLAGASAILVGSRHTAESLWGALGDRQLERRTRLGPPGVDVQRFAPRNPVRAARGLRELIDGLRSVEPTREHSGGDAFARDERAAACALQRIAALGTPQRPPLVAFVGKLIVSKGVDLLLAAWPLVLARRPDARLLIVGFGAYRDGLGQLLRALAGGDLASARRLALAGRALELQAGGERSSGERSSGEAVQPLRHLLAFLDSLHGSELQAYLTSAAALGERVAFSGRLDHEELADVLPACAALVVPSTFPEAFGMVAAEAAACGVPPISARHSGLAEVSEALARTLRSPASGWLSFAVDDLAVRAIAERVLAWLQADPALVAQARERLVEVVRERWSWEGVARGVIAAALGDLDALDAPRERRAFG